MTLGTTIRTLRLTAGLSQETLALSSGISPSFLSLLEAGKRDPTVRVIKKIAGALGVAPGLLLATALENESSKDEVSAEAAALASAFRGLVRATQHLVFSQRLDREEGERKQKSVNVGLRKLKNVK